MGIAPTGRGVNMDYPNWVVLSDLSDEEMARINRAVKAKRATDDKRVKTLRCFRCGSYKDTYRFREDQKPWARWCDTCEATPIGVCSSPF